MSHKSAEAVFLEGASGLRVGELLGLKWEDVDFERNLIHIKRSIVKQRISPPKTEASQKPTPLNGELAKTLRLWKMKTIYNRPDGWVYASAKNREIPMDVLDERVKPILMSLCGTKNADEFVFVNPKTKKPYTDIKKAFASACKKAGVRDLEWHDLRATFCTRLALAGYDAFTIKAIMGHRDMKTTERYIRANRLTKEVVFQRVHKLATNQERPPLQVAVSS